MKKIFSCLLFCLFSFIWGCAVEVSQGPVEKDGRMYGTTQGAFRHRWWNYYERGLSFSEGDLWKEAEADFRQAVSQASADERRARTYGLHFVDYFPRRELGVALFHQHRYAEAAQELEASLSTEISARAQFYLDKTRKAMIEQAGSDLSPPRIAISAPARDVVTKDFSITVTGEAADDTFVKEIRINNRPVRVDLSSPRILFTQAVPILAGENTIQVEARDLTGKVSRENIRIGCDRSGPIVTLDDITLEDRAANVFHIKGYVFDDSGIKTVQINEKSISGGGGKETEITHSAALGAGGEIIIIAEDQAGNRTRAEFTPSSLPRRSRIHPESLALGIGGLELSDHTIHQPILLAALESDGYAPPIMSGTGHAPWISAGNRPGSGFILAQDDGQRGRVLRAAPGQQANVYQELGNYHALIIGINDYEEWPHLKTAVNDASAMKDILIKRYGFPEKNVTLMTDKTATRSAIIDNLMRISTSLGEIDNLLIYFAGHGQLDEKANDGYWIPTEGKTDRIWSWISHSTIVNLMGSEGVKGKNIIVIADSCYGGNLARGDEPVVSGEGDEHQRKIAALAGKKSRQIISSGSLEPVADWGKENHSLFAYYLLKALEENACPLVDLKSLVHTAVWKPVVDKGGQRPIVGRFSKSMMDDDGEFVLVQKDKLPQEAQTAMAQGPALPVRQNAPEILQPAPVKIADKTPPALEMEIPEEPWTVFTDKAYLEGKASDDTGIRAITINGQQVLRKSGRVVYFNHLLALKEGDNLFAIECTDEGGNTFRKEVGIHRTLQKIYQDDARTSLVLFPFEVKGDAAQAEVKDMVLDYLFDSKRFNIKQRLIQESAQTRLVEENVSEIGGKFGVDAVLLGKVAARDNSFEITARIIDAETSELLVNADVYGENVDTETIRNLCEGLVLKIRDALPLVEGVVVEVDGESIIVDIGQNRQIRKNMKLIVYELGKPIIHPKTGKVLKEGRMKELALAKINTVDEEISIANVTEHKEKSEIQPMHSVITQ
jgi:TolB-like protein